MTNVLSALNKINYRLWWQLWGLQFPEDFQKFRNAGRHWRPGLQSWKPNREEEKARKLLKGELRNSSLLKGKKKQTANGNQGNFFVPMLSCFQKKNSCITENNSFSNHKSDYEALQGCKLFIKAKEPEKVDNETFRSKCNRILDLARRIFWSFLAIFRVLQQHWLTLLSFCG